MAHHLLAITILTHGVSLAELSAVHEHRDRHGPAISQEDSEKYRRDFLRLRKPYLAELTPLGITINLEAYLEDETRDFLDAARFGRASDPCRDLVALTDKIHSP